MSYEIAGLIGIAVLILLLFSRMWIGLAMLFVGVWGLVYMGGSNEALAVLGTVPYSSVAQYSLSSLPLFIFMGVIVSCTGLGEVLYAAAYKWMGMMRGGLAMATIMASAGFAAISGSSSATAVTLGKVALPEMKKYKYDDSLAAGCTAAGGTMGILIPPSIGFILYGILTEVSIGKLFMAGIIPGVLQAVFYVATIWVICQFKPSLGPAAPKTTFREKTGALILTWPIILLFLLVVGGIYTGIFTPTEAGAIGAFGALVITLITRRLTVRIFIDAAFETGCTTAMIILLVVGAFVFSHFIAVSMLPFMLGDFITGLAVSRYVILALIICLYILFGMFLDIFAAIILTVPIFFPIITALGFDTIWYGVIMVRVMEMGLITPPVGMNVFILAGVTNTPLNKIFRGVFPFLMADIFHLILLIAIPELSLLIPNMMK